MKLSIVAIFSAVAAAVSAYTPPVGEPKGNPIGRPGLNEQVEAGKPFTITWSPTTEGTVSLVLLRGPTENVVPISTIVEGIANSGSFVWTPATTLEADVARYGIQIIVDGTGQFQYSTQFGIANDGAAAPAPEPTTTESKTTTKAPEPTTTETEKEEPTTTKKTTTPTPTTLTTSTLPGNTTTYTTSTKATTSTEAATTTTEEATEEETEAPTTPSNGTDKPVKAPIQEESSAGKLAGSFGLVALVAGVVAFGL